VLVCGLYTMGGGHVGSPNNQNELIEMKKNKKVERLITKLKANIIELESIILSGEEDAPLVKERGYKEDTPKVKNEEVKDEVVAIKSNTPVNPLLPAQPECPVLVEFNEYSTEIITPADWVKVFDKVWIAPIVQEDLGVVVVQGKHTYTVMFMNCFGADGLLGVKADIKFLLSDWNYGTEYRTVMNAYLQRGQMACVEWIDPAQTSSDGETTLKGISAWLHSNTLWNHIDEEGHFDGIPPFFASKQGNEGGAGHGIYAKGMPWLLDSPEGEFLAHRATVGAAQRHRCWRFDKVAWGEGKIEPYVFKDFMGFDKTRTVNLPPFGDQSIKIDGYDQFNSNHLGRFGNWANFAAVRGDPFSKLALRTLADEVRLGWCRRSQKAKNLVEADSPGSYSWFGCYEILEYYPEGVGCHLMGRGFAHDLLILVNAEKHFPGRYMEDLKLMLETILHVWNEEDGCVYLIPYLDPIFKGYTIGAWKKKVNVEDGDTIPRGMFPPVAKTFEAVLLHYSMSTLYYATPYSYAFDHIIKRHKEILLKYPYELRVVGQEKYSDRDQALGTLLMLDKPGDRWLNGRSVQELREALDNGPGDLFVGDSPCYAASQPKAKD
jgi:hypothetical protein